MSVSLGLGLISSQFIFDQPSHLIDIQEDAVEKGVRCDEKEYLELIN